jgi:cytochrome c oxidase assembly protein subunit 15
VSAGAATAAPTTGPAGSESHTSEPSRTGGGGRPLAFLAWATLIANVVIVVTGGAVRLTASGLGCPTWPECSTGAFIAHPSLGIHGAIEFGNRLLTFVLVGIVLATFVVAWFVRRPSRADRTVRWLTVAVALTIPLQAVLGGITVLTHLNPWVVSAHFLFSMAIIALCTVLVRRVAWPSLRTREPLTSVRLSGWLPGVVTALVLAAGTVVTGSGPHAGDLDAKRNGLSPAAVSQLHADLVFLLLGVTIGALLVGRAADRAWVTRAALVLLVVESVQAVIGFVQYFTGLPLALVNLHMLGAALLTAAATDLVLWARRGSGR